MKKVISALIVLLILSNQITALSNFILPINVPNKEYLINFVLFVPLVVINWRGGLKVNKYFFRVFLLICAPLFLGYLFENLRYLLTADDYNIIKTELLLFNLIVTFLAISIAVKDKFDFLRILEYYFNANLIIAVSAVVVFFALQFGLLTLENWNLPQFIGTSFERKIDFYSGDFNYYFPLYLTIVASYVRDVGVFGAFGAFTGLSYEPHLAGFFMGPAFFMGIYFTKNYNTYQKYAVWVSFIIFFLIATSLTNLLAISFVLCTYLMIRSIKSIGMLIKIFVALNIVLWTVVVFFADYVDLFWTFVEYKFQSRSNEESSGFIKYMLSPNEILGDGIFNFPIVTQSRDVDDVGFIGTLFFVVIYAILIFSIIYLLIKNKGYYWLGLAILYFVIHSLKFPFHVIQYPFMIFIFSVIAFSFTNKSLSHQ